jgi:hypothetical protein
MERTQTETVEVKFTREDIEAFLREKAKVPQESSVHFNFDYEADHTAFIVGAVVVWSHVVEQGK